MSVATQELEVENLADEAFSVIESFTPFVTMVPEQDRVTNEQLTTMQINIGYQCNLACRHCH